jgi:hypothetical protein
MFQSDADYTLDFNGMPKTQVRSAVVFRGAYAGEGQNPGWKLDAAMKAPAAWSIPERAPRDSSS